MIITLTPNPSLDRTIELRAPLARGEVQRAVSSREEPGGKGVNIVRALEASAILSLAILPGDELDPVLVALRAAGVPHLGMPIGATIRSNIALTEIDGTTTKVNVPGPVLSTVQQSDLIELVMEQAEGASWLVLAGSLPPGVPVDFYADITRKLRRRFGAKAPRVAVDSSGAPLAAAVAAGPDLIKPNAEELAELTGIPDPDSLEGNPVLVARAAERLVATGVGAVLVTGDGAWLAQTQPILARSTVGAGDSYLAGYLLSNITGGSAPDSLRQAAAHGAAAASLPGSTVPALHQTRPGDVTLTLLNTHPKEDVQ
ncbi:MAG: hexose kinase [Cryobacterium sp.]|nr:hexose kinase [Cryobacterium sp.]